VHGRVERDALPGQSRGEVKGVRERIDATFHGQQPELAVDVVVGQADELVVDPDAPVIHPRMRADAEHVERAGRDDRPDTEPTDQALRLLARGLLVGRSRAVVAGGMALPFARCS
jgi:hypothetical protein